MATDDTQPPGPKRSKVLDAPARAERAVFTRPRPKSARAQMKFLLTKAKGSMKALTERLGVSCRTVERHRSGDLTTPQKRLRAALVEETESEWQPRVRAQAREHAATTGGRVPGERDEQQSVHNPLMGTIQDGADAVIAPATL